MYINSSKNIFIYTSLKISTYSIIVLIKMPMSGKFIELDYYLNHTDKKFYYVNDIKFTLKKLGLPYSGKKAETKERLDKFYKSMRRYKANINTIIKIQKMFRNKIKSRYLEFKGPGFLDKSCVLMTKIS